MGDRRDPLRLTLQVALYIFLYAAMAFAAGPLLYWAGEYLIAITVTGLAAACFTNWLSLRIYEDKPLWAIGLGRAPGWLQNLGWGLAGGMSSAALVLALPLLAGAAHLRPVPDSGAGAGQFVFVSTMLLCGAAGEEILFRGYGFQLLIRALGAAATIFPVGVLFALLHAGNPNATPLGLANTAGFGILFGYAFLRSRDLWLPIGLHFGWNLTLPLFGVNVSGLRIGMTGYAMEWTAGKLWSGGDYGPEASILTSGVLALLFVFLMKAPVRRRHAPLLDPPAED
ncbi:MAG: lysostaphin resistance A-like protein [Bryobacteraceae bacterium]